MPKGVYERPPKSSRKQRRAPRVDAPGRLRLFNAAAGGRPPPEDVAARLAEIPGQDRRSVTGQLLGDPLPERSALGGTVPTAESEPSRRG